jgi:hypothetical protein
MARSRWIALALLVACALPASAQAGSVTLVRSAGASGDVAWTRAHISRLHGATAWDPSRTWIRRSALALDTATAAAHPEWVLKDAYGTYLYVGSAFAADLGNPAYRAWWIAQASSAAAGAAGVYVDDVAMERRATYYGGYFASIRDPRTGSAMSEATWQRYMADFMVELRAALPAAELVHDVVWAKGDARADIQRELGAASAIALENPSLTNPVAWEAFAAYVERRKAAGTGVILDSYADSPGPRLYGLAAALLLSAELGNDAWTAKERWWTGYDLDIGGPTGVRWTTAGVSRRDFARGIVLLNPLGNGTRTVSVGEGWVDLDGVARNTLSMPPGTGAVLVRAPAPVPTPTPVAPVAPPVSPPVATPTPEPARPTPPRRPSSKAHIAGADGPQDTVTTVGLTRTKVFGRVAGAVSGYTRIWVRRKRAGKWVTVRRAKDSVSKSGRYHGDIKPLPRGTYRVTARFEGTGTASPSRTARTKRL